MNAFTAALKVAAKRRKEDNPNKGNGGVLGPLLIFAGVVLIVVMFIAANKDDTALSFPLAILGLILIIGGAILRQMTISSKASRSFSDASQPTHQPQQPNPPHHHQ
jgi:uncharacterized membrane protein